MKPYSLSFLIKIRKYEIGKKIVIDAFFFPFKINGLWSVRRFCTTVFRKIHCQIEFFSFLDVTYSKQN